MLFVWGEKTGENNQLIFRLKLDKPCTKLVICAVDTFQVFLDNEFSLYGPSRTASGYTKPCVLDVTDKNEILVKVISYGTPCYIVDFQSPFFGAEVFDGDNLVYSTQDFECLKELSKIENMPRYSRQRGYVEGYDFTKNGYEIVPVRQATAPKIIENSVNRSLYKDIFLSLDKIGVIDNDLPFSTPWWCRNPSFCAKPTDFDFKTEFIDVINGYNFYDFSLENVKTGFIGLDLETDVETTVFIVFEEYLGKNGWTLRRNANNNFLYLKIPKGKFNFLSFEPYSFKYVKIISSTEIGAKPFVKTLQNDFKRMVTVSGNSKIERLFYSAENTFRQSAVDIFMDCPDRERAGWLCDSYFTALSERLFTGENVIEKDFLNNFLIAKTEELPEKVLPMCFPSQHSKNAYIPNWAMWFNIEIEDYFNRTGDREFVEKAKDTAYGIIEFFDKYVNEFGLLEDLESWVFVDSSTCGKPEFAKGVSYPSNMLFAYMLIKVGKLYDDKALIVRATKMRERIVKESFDGQFFIENAVRVDGKPTICKERVSEACQYYALFTELCPNDEFRNKIMQDFGVLGKYESCPNIVKSDMFIANYLRLFWLRDSGEYDRCIEECLTAFDVMVTATGTLWEHNLPTNSCNHGFASSVAVVLLKCLIGYQTVKDGQPVLENDFIKNEKYGVSVAFNYNR